MRYFLTRRDPPVDAILLAESGSRGILERTIVPLRRQWGEEIHIDLVTCFDGLPDGFRPETTRVYQVAEFRGSQRRRALYRELVGNRYSLVGIVCSGEALMTWWKWALALRLPAKVYIINENGDYFPLDRGNLRNLRLLLLSRTGLGGAGAARLLGGVLTFPFTLLYLLLYATAVHARRALRRG